VFLATKLFGDNTKPKNFEYINMTYPPLEKMCCYSFSMPPMYVSILSGAIPIVHVLIGIREIRQTQLKVY
jgi:hypothetical protein